jgi:hypothetical protein
VSRGYGYVQRFVLAELDRIGEHWLPLVVLAERLDGTSPFSGQRRTVRRAVRRLVADGLVEVRSIGSGTHTARIQPASEAAIARRRADAASARALRRRLHAGERPRRHIDPTEDTSCAAPSRTSPSRSRS